MGEGASIVTSRPLLFLGKAMKSRMLSLPPNKLQAVEPKANPPWGAHVLERVHQEPKLRLRFFRREAKEVKHARLDVFVVDPDGPSANLDTVDDHVVGVGLDGAWVDSRMSICSGLGDVKVVHGVVTLGVFVPFRSGSRRPTAA